MLHSCDAAEYSVLTTFARPYTSEDPKNASSKSLFVDGPVFIAS